MREREHRYTETCTGEHVVTVTMRSLAVQALRRGLVATYTPVPRGGLCAWRILATASLHTDVVGMGFSKGEG